MLGGSVEIELDDGTTKRLGIGTTTPQQGLHVHNTGLQLTNGSTGNSSTDGFTIEFNGSNAQLRLKENAEIQFRTNAPGTTDSVKMRLTATGQLLFFDPSNGAQYRIDLPNSNSLGVGYIRARGLSSYSSRAWKEDIRPIAGALEKVLALRGVEYRWKPAYGGNQDLGFIAEEVDAVLPEVVQKSQSGEYLGMDYTRILPVVLLTVLWVWGMAILWRQDRPLLLGVLGIVAWVTLVYSLYHVLNIRYKLEVEWLELFVCAAPLVPKR
ncbi:MAG: hypothetical protein KatS3mg040_0090 [Candidatus Kapaibacterium sp.]|nr:MAG: hypothetical protein KatS3mg040_0090 [Candidatus Kapabacteria bacterium]